MADARDLGVALARIARAPRFALESRVTRIAGPVIEASRLHVAIGEICQVSTLDGATMDAEVVGFHERGVLLMPFGDVEGIHPGAAVRPRGQSIDLPTGEDLMGRVLDGLGRPIDGRGPLRTQQRRSVSAVPPHPLERALITQPLTTGVRALDGLLTLGKGQRVGIFSGSGVGKSVLLGMMARGTTADVNVIALLGERGREVRDFIERDLGAEGLRRSVVVVATSDQAALLRAKGALVATTIAEGFRETGRDVLLLLDSITRVAMAWREIGLAAGEPPTTKGYPPSVFAALPRLLERAGTARRGSITGLYTVLVEGDDFNEPIADAARSVLDGHLTLSRRLANLAHFPAIDVLESVSRVRDQVVDGEQRRALELVLRLEAAHRAHEDLLAVGAYQKGANRDVDAAVATREAWLGFVRQRPDEPATASDTRRRLLALAAQVAALS
ncbi:MAG TPA: FliI/YscN family ATPase [Gemmatimonadales bacterium]|nr:FliI/YscN family ATPase [Gemmatimonadales bacterium]